MALKEKHRVFFATPFDVATQKMYEWIGGELRRSDPGLTTAIGAAEVGPSPQYSTIASFKAQNVELFERIVGQIRIADVIVADLTNNNPNVHVELGIALTLNKNILRVTGRSLIELGFDIRGLEVHQYSDREDLLRRVTEYTSTFGRIKNLPLDETAGELYQRDTATKAFNADDSGGWQYGCLDRVFRDGAIRVRFANSEINVQMKTGLVCISGRAEFTHGLRVVSFISSAMEWWRWRPLLGRLFAREPSCFQLESMEKWRR